MDVFKRGSLSPTDLERPLVKANVDIEEGREVLDYGGGGLWEGTRENSCRIGRCNSEFCEGGICVYNNSSNACFFRHRVEAWRPCGCIEVRHNLGRIVVRKRGCRPRHGGGVAALVERSSR